MSYTLDENGVPVISGTLGVIHGETLALHDVGDHHLWLGKVSKVEESKPTLLLRSFDPAKRGVTLK